MLAPAEGVLVHPLIVPVLAAAGLLALAGVHKVRRPDGTAQALRTQGLPSSRPVVRLLGVAEVAVAAVVLAGLPAAPALLAAAYAGFTGFVLLALLRDRPLSSCGCFGEPDTPPSWTHVAVTAGLAAAAAAAVVGGGSGARELLDASAGSAVATAAAAALVGWLAWVALVELPPVLAATASSTTVEEPHDGPQLFTILPVRSPQA